MHILKVLRSLWVDIDVSRDLEKNKTIASSAHKILTEEHY